MTPLLIQILFIICLVNQQCFCVPPTPTDFLINDIKEIKENINALLQNSKTNLFNQQPFISLQTTLTSIDINIKNLQERAHIWDTFQLHVSAWNEQLSTVDRKLDILSKAQEKLDDLDSKLNSLPSLEFKLFDKITAIETFLQEINTKLDDKKQDKSLFEEFAARGILSTLKQVEKKIDKINLHNLDIKQIVGKSEKVEIDEILKDISSKVDVIFDKLSDKVDALEEGYIDEQVSGESLENRDLDVILLKKSLKRLGEPCKRTGRVLEKMLTKINKIENNTDYLMGKCDKLKEINILPDITTNNYEEINELTTVSLSPSINLNSDLTYCYSLQNYSGVFTFFSPILNDINRDYNKRLCNHGWMVIQRRDFYEPQENFNRSWFDYKMGFGLLEKDFWFGNDYIHKLSMENDLVLRVELENFDGIKVWGEYEIFKVGNESEFYQIEIGGYSGTASDSFSSHNGSKFSTYDYKNDDAPLCCPCALSYGSGWWFNSCFESNLNGVYYESPHTTDYYKGIIWEHWLGNYSLKKTKMMVKPKGDITLLKNLQYKLIYVEDP